MTQIDVTTEEARLIGVARAISKFDNPHLVNDAEVGEVVQLLEAVIDLAEQEKTLSGKELNLLLFAFVAGYGANKIHYLSETLPPLPEEPYFSGGPTGGVAEQQGADPRFVTQSGVHEDK